MEVAMADTPAVVGSAPEQAITLTPAQLSELVRPLLRDAVQAAPPADGDASATGASIDALVAGLTSYLQAHMRSTKDSAAAGMALPDVDEQLLPLQQQVDAVLQQVAAQRASVPAVVSKALQQQLEAMRPAADAGDAAGAADQSAAGGAAAAAAGAEAGVAQARQLHSALQAALNKLPALRARLEEVDERLQRNLAAVDASQGAAAHTPRTVERVVRSVAAARSSVGGAGGLAAETPAPPGVAHDEGVDEGGDGGREAGAQEAGSPEAEAEDGQVVAEEEQEGEACAGGEGGTGEL